MNIVKLPVLLIAMVLTLIAAVFHWYFDMGGRIRFSSPWLGVLLGIIGFLVMSLAARLFKQQGLAIMPAAKTAHLTTAGLYRFTRNPMYLGTVLISLGISLYIGTIPFYVSTMVYFAVLNFIFCRYEENKLTEAFGHEYTEYRDRVRRWL